MSTVSKDLADAIKDADGFYSTDARVLRIVRYRNRWDGISYGLEYQHSLGKYEPSDHVLDPEIYWEAKA